MEMNIILMKELIIAQDNVANYIETSFPIFNVALDSINLELSAGLMPNLSQIHPKLWFENFKIGYTINEIYVCSVLANTS